MRWSGTRRTDTIASARCRAILRPLPRRRDPDNTGGARRRRVRFGPYGQGLAVAERMLTADAGSATTLVRRAVLLAKLGRRDEARAAAVAGAFEALADPRVLYGVAVVFAIIGDPQAVSVLRAAIDAGYPRAAVLRDDEWEPLREDEQFRRATSIGRSVSSPFARRISCASV